MPRNALQCKACGEQSEDFSAALRRKSSGIVQAVKKSGADFFDSLRPGAPWLRALFRIYTRYRPAPGISPSSQAKGMDSRKNTRAKKGTEITGEKSSTEMPNHRNTSTQIWWNR